MNPYTWVYELMAIGLLLWLAYNQEVPSLNPGQGEIYGLFYIVTLPWLEQYTSNQGLQWK